MSHTPSPKSGKAVLLGLFVCWQFFYLPVSNLIQFVPVRVPEDPGDVPASLQSLGRFTDDDRLQTLADAAVAGLTRYSEFSGQQQYWKLFTPEFPAHTIVLVTRAEFADGRTVEIVSPRAPAFDPPTARWPRGSVRPFHIEACVGLGPWAATWDWVARQPDAARGFTVEWSGGKAGACRVILKQHWARYKADHPDEPDPTRLTLVTRFLAKPGEWVHRHGPPPTSDVPFVRWSNPFGTEATTEVYDPISRSYVPVPEVRP